MKKYLGIICIICINISCNSKNNKIATSNNISYKDTLYVKTDSCIILEKLYLNLDSIKIGDAFTSKNNQFGYYRLLFSSYEEVQNIYIEKINIIDDGIVKLDYRIKLSPELLGHGIETSTIKFIKWETPEIVGIKTDSTNICINITNLIKDNLE